MGGEELTIFKMWVIKSVRILAGCGSGAGSGRREKVLTDTVKLRDELGEDGR